MTCKTLRDAIEHPSLKRTLPELIKNEYRSCLPRLSYPTHLMSTPTQLREFYARQIAILDELLRKQPEFLHVLTNVLAELMIQYSNEFDNKPKLPTTKESSAPASASMPTSAPRSYASVAASAPAQASAGTSTTSSASTSTGSYLETTTRKKSRFIPWYVHVGENQLLVDGEGSYRAALYKGILKPLRFCLTLLLSLLDQNLNLRTLYSGSLAVQKLWLDICRDKTLWFPLIRSAFSPRVAQRLFLVRNYALASKSIPVSCLRLSLTILFNF